MNCVKFLRTSFLHDTSGRLTVQKGRISKMLYQFHLTDSCTKVLNTKIQIVCSFIQINNRKQVNTKNFDDEKITKKITNVLLLSSFLFLTSVFYLNVICVMKKSSHRRSSTKKVFLKISQYSQENTFVGVSF